jgi:hypothetical protein
MTQYTTLPVTFPSYPGLVALIDLTDCWKTQNGDMIGEILGQRNRSLFWMMNPVSMNAAGGADKQVTKVKMKQEIPAAARQVTFLLPR